jgi:ATP-dependent DNA helicase RecG
MISPEHIFHTENDRSLLLVEFPVHPVFAKSVKLKGETEVTMEVKRLLNAITGDHSRNEPQEMLGLKNADHFRKAYLLPAIKAGCLEMTRPDKLKSRLQKYRLTDIGQAVRKDLLKTRK